ncbi:hypothetical protein G5B37_08850 [Rasiella rasia]|uniref:Uncharacterized protein n=1 Tax=Rasiella rasia TaxID=2744027 RepID=A0A6G6GM85_9FLAO|nr:hypothetical protein [Rasiella rasia]QIE59669.1 hypothetical protein G5B37_08850 [Rasiella rasia]
MNFFLRLGAYVLHPLLMPLVGTLLYFIYTPRYVEIDIAKSRLLAVVIITVFIPIVTFFLLRNLNLVSSIHLEDVKERKTPLMLQSLLILLIIKMVFDPQSSAEPYYFFVGILFSGITALFLVFLKFKVSLHQMGIAGVTMFLIGLSVHFQINMLLWMCVFFIANGWVASSRLHTNSHTYPELIAGFFIGFIPQLLLFNYWL